MTPTPVHVVASWHTSSKAVKTVREILVQLSSASLNEPGCESFRIFESVEPRGRFTLVEQYASQEAREQHVASPHFQDLVLRQAVPLLTRREIDECVVIAE